MKANSLLFFFLIFALIGCSGSQEPQADLDNFEQDQGVADDEFFDDELAEDQEVEDGIEARVEADQEPAEKSSADSAIAPPSQRLVRYTTDTASYFSEPNSNGSASGEYSKGEMLLIEPMENGWGKISPTRYIELSRLSAKAIPREKRKATWR